MKKRILALLSALICMLTLASCGQNIAKEAAEKGRSYFDSGEYETAAKAFGAAIDNGSEDEEIKLLYGICLSYYQAGQEMAKGELENVKKILDGIDAGYTKYGISEEIDTMRKNVELTITAKTLLADAAYRASVADFSGAAAVIAGIDTTKLSEADMATLSGINALLAEAEAAKAAADKKKAETVKKEQTKPAAKPVETPSKPVNTAPTINVNVANDAYIFPTDTQLLTVGHLQNISSEAIALIRNEIYARHGQIFTTEKYINYFSAKTWYKPVKEVRWGDLNSIERQNVLLIQQYESGALR